LGIRVDFGSTSEATVQRVFKTFSQLGPAEVRCESEDCHEHQQQANPHPHMLASQAQENDWTSKNNLGERDYRASTAR
jgi:hypothetical protein